MLGLSFDLTLFSYFIICLLLFPVRVALAHSWREREREKERERESLRLCIYAGAHGRACTRVW